MGADVRWRRVLRAGARGVAVATLAGCDHPMPPVTAPRPTARAEAALSRRPPFSAEQHLFDLATQIRGFGGYAVDPDGNVTVFLTDLDQTQAVVAALAPLRKDADRHIASLREHRAAMTTGPGAGPPMPPLPAGPGQVIVKRGEYGWLDLSDWRDLLTAHVLTLPGAVSVGIDESHNRVAVSIDGQRAATLRPIIDRRLSELGIPAAAVVITESGPVDPIVKTRPISLAALLGPALAGGTFSPYAPCETLPGNTIRSRQRPLIGGIMICQSNHATLEIKECTIGFIATRLQEGWTRRFVTASHCSDQQGVVDSTVFGQPTVATADSVAFEVEDPMFRTNITGCPTAPTLRACRNSDALLTSKMNGLTSGALGYIARTSMYDLPQWYVINMNDGGIYSRLVIEHSVTTWGDLATPYLRWIGAATAWHSGYRTQRCQNMRMGDHIILCQSYVDGWADEGDSGAPIFEWTGSPSEASVVLYGILVGTSDTPTLCPYNGRCVWYSPTYQIDLDIPGLISNRQ